MKAVFTNFQPRATQTIKALYLNLIDEKEKAMKKIEGLAELLQKCLNGENEIPNINNPLPVSRAGKTAMQERIQELQGYSPRFKTTQLPQSYTGKEICLALEGLVMHLQPIGVKLIKKRTVEIKKLCTFAYNKNGIIVDAIPDLGWQGLNALEVLGGMCAQDFGLIIERQKKLIYFYSSSRYEKTPKHIENGYDYFVGEDFLEWHRRIPGWGKTLSALLEVMYRAFKQNILGSLVIDLKGRNSYTNGEAIVCRYERDYAVPLKTISGKTMGIIVFADVLFKNIKNEEHPFYGGKHLKVLSPRRFHEHFRVVTHPHFHHHPCGMRHASGRHKDAFEKIQH